MLVIPLTVFSQIILERPAILEGMTWLLEAQTFASSQNHVDLLLAMGETQVLSPAMNSCLVCQFICPCCNTSDSVTRVYPYFERAGWAGYSYTKSIS